MLKNKQSTEPINEGQWAKEQFETRYKKELEDAGFKIVKGTGKWGKAAKMVVRDKKGFDRIATGENGEIGYAFIAECTRLIDRRNAVHALRELYPQMASVGWHCDPVFDMVKAFTLTMQDGMERSVPLTMLSIHKLTEELKIRIREVKIVEMYQQMAEFNWDVNFTDHIIRIEEQNSYGYTEETKKKYNIYDYWKEEDFDKLITYYDHIVEMMN